MGGGKFNMYAQHWFWTGTLECALSKEIYIVMDVLEPHYVYLLCHQEKKDIGGDVCVDL